MDRVHEIFPDRPNDPFEPIIKKLAYGNPLREGIDMIIHGQNGALICIGDVENILMIGNGGFRIDVPFTPQRLFELSKMDGAIVLSEDLNQIVCANFHLNPDPSIFTLETGMRHRSAERTSAQTDATVIAISKRRTQTTLYRRGENFTLESDQMLLSKGNQGILALQNLKNALERASMRLSFLELDDIVTVYDVVRILARYNALITIAVETERYINYLGNNSGILCDQLDEIMNGIAEAFLLIIRDYAASEDHEDAKRIACLLLALPQSELHDRDKIMSLLGFTESFIDEDHVSPRGYRAISRISMVDEATVARIIEEFGSLSAIVKDSIDGFDRLESMGADIGISNVRALAKSFMQLRSTL